MPELHVACAADDGYMPYCATMLQSLLLQHPAGQVTVHFLYTSDAAAAPIQALRQLVQQRGGSFQTHGMDAATIASLPRMPRIPPNMWLRIWMPELLAEGDRVLYLDVDTLIMQPLDTLWETPLGDNLLGAVDNVLEPAIADRPDTLGLPEGSGYFNSGVLLMDLAGMRREQVTRQILDDVERFGDRLIWPDQDALNRAFAGRRTKLHPRWNCQNSFFYWRDWSLPVFGEAALDDAVSRPGILHFEGPAWAKPWHYLSDHPYRRAWQAHQRDCGWPAPPLTGRTMKNVLIRHTPEPMLAPLRRLMGHRPRPAPQLGTRRMS